MKKIKNIILIFLSLPILYGCDYLDIVPSEIITEEDVFNDIKVAESALGYLYWTLFWDHSNGITRDGLKNETGACTDEMKHHWEATYPQLQFNLGGLTTTNDVLGEWSFMYQFIRRATIFIENIDDVPLLASQQSLYSERKKLYKEEARWFRAYFYFDLLRQYGAVPLISTRVDISNVEATHLPRNSVTEIVEFIVDELDEAAKVLPDTYPMSSTQDYGRITKAACLALKSRVLLYAASPLFNGNTMYAGIIGPDGKQLFPQTYSKELWNQAATAAREAIQIAEGTGSIHLQNMDPSNPVHSYARLFYDNANAQSGEEMILAGILGNDNNMSLEVNCTSHAGDYNGNGKFSILQNQIDAYETKSGHMPFLMDDDGVIIYDANGQPTINPESGYTESGFWDGKLFDGKEWIDVQNVSNMYKDRDPRFYASVTFHGGVWKYGQVNRTNMFAYWKNQYTYGQHVDGWPNTNTNNESGYGVRKWLDPNVNLWVAWNISHNYPFFRLAEQYLNLAEALNEYLDAPTQEVYDAINAVRTRVDMPRLPITTEDRTKEGMRKRIRNERRVELFFEGHRFFDVRRWKIGEKVDRASWTMNTLPTEAELEAGARELGLTHDDPEQSRIIGEHIYFKRTKNMTRVFEEKHYLLPIPQSEINKNPNLVQNHGW